MKLIQAFGSAENVWNATKKDFLEKDGIGIKIASEIGSPEHLIFAENELKFCEKENIQIKLRHQNEFPALLSECVDAPGILYVKGNLDVSKKFVSIVGTRKMTTYGKNFIGECIPLLQHQNCYSVSGLALGVDTEVHQQSLEKKVPTIAVLAHGFQMMYPSKNKLLAEKILSENGVLITEFNSSQRPDREHFIQRNRIIAGISPATIIVETAFGGGSVSTANFAFHYNRDVFALPGKITDQFSQGCNQLIYHNKAVAISTVKDLQQELGLVSEMPKVGELFSEVEDTTQLVGDQLIIYNFIQKNPSISSDEIAEHLELPVYKILPEILELELLGKVRTHSGQRFSAL